MKFIVSFTFVILFSSLFVGDAYGAISIDKGPFTWTDKIHIKISEYGVDRASVKISTSTNQLLDYKLSKVRDNLYTGEVILTGFLHDVDGDGKPDTNPRTMGSGPNNGFLEITRDDEFKISVRFADGDKISQSVKIRWNEGTIAFDMPSYTPNEPAKLQVTDADMNLNPEALDTILVYVFSDSDKAGIQVKAIETQEESGLFETTISFTQDGSSSGNRLFSILGDMIYAQYNDYTLPKPYRVSDDLEIIAESTISIVPIQKTILDNDYMHESSVKIESNEEQFISPLKQFKSGISIDKIRCKELMILMVKYDGSPACVKKKNFEKLIQRNWGQASKETKELQTLQKMSCDEIKYDSYNRKDGYLSGDNREFARDKILDCRAEMMESEEFAIYRELGCDGWIAMDGKLHIINSNQVRDWVALEILDCKGRSLNE
jgi:hypothetical protein